MNGSKAYVVSFLIIKLWFDFEYLKSNPRKNRAFFKLIFVIRLVQYK